MSNVNILKTTLVKLYRLLSKKHKLYLLILIILTIGFSFIETLGISVIMPFISVASNPGLLDSGLYKKAFDFLGFATAESFIIALGIIIICFYIFRAVYSIIHGYLINRFSLAVYKFLSGNLFKTFLSIPYRVYTKKNSAELMQIIASESRNVSHLTLNVLQLGSELFTIVFIYTLMLVMDWKMTLILTAALALIVLSFLRFLIQKTKAMGEKRSLADRKLYRTLKEAFSNFKFVKLKGNEENILHAFYSSMETYSHAQITSSTLTILPKGILECMGFSLLVTAVIFILANYRDPSKVIPIISMYALALYRILPSVHRMLGNLNNIAYTHDALDILDKNIHQETETGGAAPLYFEKSIRLEDITFRYVTGKDILHSISFEIKKGERIAVVGESGSGKSTLADLIIGINKPDSGTIYIDGSVLLDENIRTWRSKIGYIPQSIYLFDGTVAENVAFGSDPDETRIERALKTANIWDFLSKKEGINTIVGEGGIQLSGGQLQRIGIARALYDDPDVLVLDEATSALDTETEAKIMDEIYNISKDKTLIIIAHRLSTVERCDRKIRMENGKIIS
jgi:ATP-binding cassette subfamily B protein/ATP-binding cassette subfamily C protein